MKMNNYHIWDCIIIGGGPAGLTAALYLARYRRDIMLVDNQNSRALNIPCSHNYPGFPAGISGKVLLEQLQQQVLKYHVPILQQTIESLQCLNKELFLATTENGTFYSKKIILCTGVQDIEPVLGSIKQGIKNGLIRHCPVCDAYEVIDKKIAVIGNDKHGLKEALFLRDYSKNITLLTLGKTSILSKMDLTKINQSQINIITEDILKINLSHERAEIIFSNNVFLCFDCIYSALGCINHNKLANDLHAKQKNGLLIVNKKQQTSILGLYAAGDIVSGLNQICVATGQAAIAATSIHNILNKRA